MVRVKVRVVLMSRSPILGQWSSNWAIGRKHQISKIVQLEDFWLLQVSIGTFSKTKQDFGAWQRRKLGSISVLDPHDHTAVPVRTSAAAEVGHEEQVHGQRAGPQAHFNVSRPVFTLI